MKGQSEKSSTFDNHAEGPDAVVFQDLRINVVEEDGRVRWFRAMHWLKIICKHFKNNMSSCFRKISLQMVQKAER